MRRRADCDTIGKSVRIRRHDMDCGEIRELMEQGREREAAGRLLELVA